MRDMKHILTLATFVFATSCFGQVPDFVPTDGLVAWYPFDGSLIDASGMEPLKAPQLQTKNPRRSEGLLWYYRDSNLGHTDFQSVALPTEL